MIRSDHVLPRIVTRSSGPAYSIPRLCRALRAAGADCRLHLTGEAPATGLEGVPVSTYPVDGFPRGMCVSGAMRRGLAEAARHADILHNHSLWLMPNIYPGRVLDGKSACRLVVSPRGTLSPWAWQRSRWKKAIVWRLGQRRVLEIAAMFHATSAEELGDIRRLGFRQPAAVIPNGVEVPESLPSLDAGRRPTVMFLSRIHPTKGVEELLHAWRRLEDSFPEWRLVIAGPLAGDYPRRMRDLAGELGLTRVAFPGELLGEAKAAALAAADLFVLPTRSENFGLAIAEALAHGTPAVVTRGAPWAGLETHGCGWWIEQGAEPLEKKLREAMAVPRDRLAAMGMRGREWVAREFSWDRIGRDMLAAYAWLLGRGPRPACVVEA
jgi:glycosyltransferase involved in cell wall biosynthesis